MTFSQISKKEFIQHCKLVSEKSFFQSLEMGELLSKRGYDVRFVGYRDGSSTIVISSLLFCKKMAGGLYMELNSGPVVSDNSYLDKFFQSLRDYAKHEGVLELVVKPSQTYQTFDSNGQPLGFEDTHLIEMLTKNGFQYDGLQTGYPNGEPVWYYVKDLEGYLSTSVLQSYNKNSKRNIKNSESYGIRIRSIDKDELSAFKKIIEETGARQGFEDKDIGYYNSLFESFGPRADFLVAELDPKVSLMKIDKEIETIDGNSKNYEQQVQKLLKKKEVVQNISIQTQMNSILLACALIIYDEIEATYLFGGSYSEFQNLSAPFLLQYEAMRRAINRHLKRYNFLGITGLFDGSDGVLRFKQNFNGYILRKPGTFHYFPHPVRYKTIQVIKKIVSTLTGK
ncbi:TPA: peptidoglycan bridge formation glycyltransferase FemA/FemB family protein [Streptococcus suis]|uniref:peptidoglycan bridge formation glycyltransferase FemA/FemB family protein n=1 Tax=Streptococcus suis TaxID=1307 RepID=UPI000CF439D3